jgi:hypothetical protein
MNANHRLEQAKQAGDPMGTFQFTRRDFLKAAALGATSLALPGCVTGPAGQRPTSSNRQILHQMDFTGPKDGWNWPEKLEPHFAQTPDGLMLLAGSNKTVWLGGDGVHTCNGDSIELHFSLPDNPAGALTFGFQGEPERAFVKLDFKKSTAIFSTSDWRLNQPVVNTAFQLEKKEVHTLLIEKTEGPGRLVKNADFKVYLDGGRLMEVRDQNVLPEMSVTVGVEGARILLQRFVQRGTPSGIPEYLHIGGWQMANQPDIAANLASICRGLTESANRGVQLLVTPETSLTGLFPEDAVTQNPGPIAEAEARLRSFMRNLKSAPYIIVGLPIWENSGAGGEIRYNVSRLYAPDGEIAGTFAKIHSCETNFWHGYRLNEFDIYGVPCCMHICHDGRYPETWTLPVMFGARLVVHPANPMSENKPMPTVSPTTLKCVTTVQPERETGAVGSSHAFYLNVSGTGGNIAGPQKDRKSTVEYDKWVTPGGETYESLFHKRIRVHDAFGYWPTRSFRASEQAAQSYLALYRASGGSRS